MILFLSLLKSRWTWYAILAVALIAGALGLRAHYINVGEQRGKDQQAQASQQEIELQRQAAQADAREKVAAANLRAAAAEAQAAEYALKAQRLSGQLDAARRTVDALPDSAIHGHIVGALGLRPQGDPTPGYSPAEEREIARRVDAAPLLKEQTDALAAQVSKLSDQVHAVIEANAAREAYTVRLEGWYTQLYNLHPPKARAGKCLWLWRCGENRLPVPAPKDIK